MADIPRYIIWLFVIMALLVALSEILATYHKRRALHLEKRLMLARADLEGFREDLSGAVLTVFAKLEERVDTASTEDAAKAYQTSLEIVGKYFKVQKGEHKEAPECVESAKP